ncbi:mas-related G-protein coupled receptor member X1 [Dasypus novemcinctus]|uniref:mas-related G-protein coupled receptor member X1 n=1 Tax=Dasypus novemcinctus TaxID=9361 RepID=UPI00265DE8E8|nr:mas-related G-protein coupled receptor member X1 [Dasypus novemcinctus]
MDQYCQADNASRSSADPGMSPRTAVVGHVLFRSITVVVALCGLVGNGIVIWLVRLSIKRSSFSTYTLNLALADFIHLSFQTMFSVRQILKSFLGHCFHLAGIFTVLRFFSYSTSLGIVTAISFQRCLSVLCPLWYRDHCPKHVSAMVSISLWVLTFLLNLLRGHTCGQLYSKDTRYCHALAVTTAVCTSALFSVMGVSSLVLLFRVQTGSQGHQPQRLHLVVLLTVLVFFLCGVPFGALRIHLYWTKSECLNNVSIFLTCINSAANPLIYFFFGSRERQRWRLPFKGALQRAPGGEAEGGEKPPPTGRTEAGALSQMALQPPPTLWVKEPPPK